MFRFPLNVHGKMKKKEMLAGYNLMLMEKQI